MRLSLRRAMMAIAVIGVLLATLRFGVGYHPHVRRCWELAALEDRLNRAYLLTATQYEACAQAMPTAPSAYCYNACLAHVARQPAPSLEARENAAEAHRQAAEEHREAAKRHASMAAHYRRAALHWSKPLPTDPFARHYDVFNRYRCDQF